MEERPANNGRESKTGKTILRRTLFLMAVCGVFAFLVLAIKLYKIQIRDHEKYESMAIEQQTRETVDDEWETVNNCWGYFGGVGEMLAETSATEKGVVVCTEDPYEYDEYEVTMEVAVPSKGDTKVA